MVAVGVVTTLAPVVAESAVAGDQLYVDAPVAVRVALPPVHIATPEPAFVVGEVLTVTVTIAVCEQPLPSVPVTV